MTDKKRPIFVIGHKNPDTDSICSAIAYANLKSQMTEDLYIPKRAGELNEETLFVLEKFKVDIPQYISDVRAQVKDIEIRKTSGVSKNISLKNAWTIMKSANVVTLPITIGNKLEGLITIGDIAKSYMEVYDNKILSTAHTKYANIVSTLDGEMKVGSEEEFFTEGKVVIAAANPDMMENYIESGDLVILGNRYESQLCAIEMNAGCIIICDGAKISLTISKLAMDKNCKIISSPYDPYTVARLINQSMPISYFMKRDKMIAFHIDDIMECVKEVMVKKRYRDFPILDSNETYIGMISRRNLLETNKKRIILVDHNEKSQAVSGIQEAELLEIIDHHKLGTVETVVPIYFRNQALGCTATIIYQMYQENNIAIEKNIAGLLCSAIISDTLMYRSPTCTTYDKSAANNLAQIAGINIQEYAKDMFRAGSNMTLKSPKEIFYQDFKKFSAKDIVFGIGQITSMDATELQEIKIKIMPYLDVTINEKGFRMIFFMLTNILEESTELIFCGVDSSKVVENVFGTSTKDHSIFLKGVVSRKKQVLPYIMEEINSIIK